MTQRCDMHSYLHATALMRRQRRPLASIAQDIKPSLSFRDPHATKRPTSQASLSKRRPTITPELAYRPPFCEFLKNASVVDTVRLVCQQALGCLFCQNVISKHNRVKLSQIDSALFVSVSSLSFIPTVRHTPDLATAK